MEFTEVMRHWRRMCDKHTCGRNRSPGLPICPIVIEHDGFPCEEDPIYWTEKATKQFEEIVMQWAAEHPEPVYPTWEQVIAEMYLRSGRTKYHNIKEWEINEPIPADTAQKLGIEPKGEA